MDESQLVARAAETTYGSIAQQPPLSRVRSSGDRIPDPMEPQTYQAIYRFLGREVVETDESWANMNASEYMVHLDLVSNKVRWTDDYHGDRMRFLDNIHPIFALFRSHRLHPISRCERLWVYTLQWFWVLLVALAISFAGNCGQGKCATVGSAGVGEGHACVFPFTYEGATYETCTADRTHHLWCSTKTDSNGRHVKGHWGHCWCQHDSSTQECHKLAKLACVGNDCAWSNHRRVHAILCCFSRRTGIAWFLQNVRIGGFSLGGMAYTALMHGLFAMGSFQLMICGCVQRASARVRRIGETVGHVLYAFLTLLILMPQPFLIYYAVEQGLFHVTLVNFVGGKIFGSLGIGILQVVAFHFIWKLQYTPLEIDASEGKPSEVKQSRNCVPMFNFHVTAAEYEYYVSSLLEASPKLKP